MADPKIGGSPLGLPNVGGPLPTSKKKPVGAEAEAEKKALEVLSGTTTPTQQSPQFFATMGIPSEKGRVHERAKLADKVAEGAIPHNKDHSAKPKFRTIFC